AGQSHFGNKTRKPEYPAQHGSYVAAARSPWRVASSVLISDSFGSPWIIGSIIHPKPRGTSRVSEIARHSMHTSLPRAVIPQEGKRRHRNPCPVSGGSTLPFGFPSFSTSAIRVVYERQTQRI